jgi:HD-GYP domain-containing protein (c-di-GMP phosphodiesterase class II)
MNPGGKHLMLKKIKAADLRIGMFVVLPNAWRAHPLLRNNFTITSQKQIQTIIECGVEDVNIDEDKGIATSEYLPPDYQSLKNLSTEVVTEKLKEVIHDKKMSPEPKAQAVHLYSVGMVNKLLDKPTRENISQFKKDIVDVVDLILADDATNQHLLQLTSHDYNTYIHSVNVGVYGISLAKAVFTGEDKHNMHALGAGFFLHDIGKVHIDEAIINKPGKLTEEEMAVMRKHPSLGFKLLNETKQINEESRLIVLQHHERENGTGYPRKLHGDEIHIYGRICSVADVYDALISKRPYKAMLKPFEALKVMKEEMLDHFQKEVFEKFVLLFK